MAPATMTTTNSAPIDVRYTYLIQNDVLYIAPGNTKREQRAACQAFARHIKRRDKLNAQLAKRRASGEG